MPLVTGNTLAFPLQLLRLWDDCDVARPGAVNMAIDEALLSEAVRLGGAILRLYRWERPTLSFGYFLTQAEAQAARRPGEEMVRRWTGGGLVHHEATVTWTLVVPGADDFYRLRPPESYAVLHTAVAACLTNMLMGGVGVVPAVVKAPAGGLCAEVPAPGDLIWQGRKIAGAGQRRTRLGLLHQGVIFLPEARLGGTFPDRLASSLAEAVVAFTPPGAWNIPVARYADPAWNAKR